MRALNLLQFMPKIGRPAYPGVRTWALKRFPYTLAYRVYGQLITVLAVAHQSREPGYWEGRQ
jgi:toxin ParE1/3/4